MMNKKIEIDLIVISSELQTLDSVLKARTPLFEALRAFAHVNIIPESEYLTNLDNIGRLNDNDALSLLFVATGGTEEKFLNIFTYLPQPVVILSDGYYNSLAASFEICTWLKNNNIEHYMLHAPAEITPKNMTGIRDMLVSLGNQLAIRKELSGQKIGLIGGASPWLISSYIDKEFITGKFNIAFIEISSDEVTEKFKKRKASRPDYTNLPDFQYYQSLLQERSPEDLADAYSMYLAIGEVCQDHDLNAVTIKCFDLINQCQTTACLALAILNDKNLVAGCEGDLPALCTQLAIKRFHNQCGFIANPASADKNTLTVDFAHCTIPFSMTSASRLPSHFESGTGIGIQGTVPPGEYTLLKLSGTHFDKRYSCTGNIIEAPYVPNRCRTQVRFKFKSAEDFDTFMESRMGNHVVITNGTITI